MKGDVKRKNHPIRQQEESSWQPAPQRYEETENLRDEPSAETQQYLSSQPTSKMTVP